MTISTTTSRISYNGNGVTTVFSFPYRFLANGDLVVLSVSAAGVETTKTLTTDYTLTGAGDDAGGSVTMLVAPASGTRLIIYRDTDIVQETDYISGDPFPAETHEQALDRLTMIAQEIGSDADRSIKVPVGDSSSLSTTLPASANRLDKFLAFDSSTGEVEVSTITQTQVASAVAAAYAAGSTADAVTFLQEGTGAVSRSVQAKLRDQENISPADFGAVGDGTTDDTTAISNMVTAQASKLFKFGPVTLTNNEWLDFNYQRAKSTAAAAHMVKLTNFAPVVSRMYVSDATGATYAFVIGASRFARLTDLWVLNCDSGGGINIDPDASSTNKPILRDIVVEEFLTNGVNVETNVSEINAVNVYLDSGTTAVASLAIPKRGTVGWKQNTPIGSFAVGGHLLTNVTVINCETGFHFTDAQLTSLANCIADSTAGYGIKIDGACDYLDFNGVFVGTSMGVYVGGTSQHISFSGLNTVLTGVIPSWGDSTFYLAAGPYYDVTVADTAEVKIEGDSWFGRKQVSVAAGATLNVNGGERRLWDTNATVAAAATVYLDDDGASATEGDTVYRMPFDGYVFSLDCYADGSPGGSDTFTYTVRVSAADTTLTATISAAETSKRAYPSTAIFATKGAAITIKLVTSATATARRHTGNLHILGV